MKLQQLEFFIAVSETGSLGKAAEQLYTSQPNVSKVIRSLEEELRHPLFERTTRGLKLNSYGKAIYEYASNILTNARMIAHVCSSDSSDIFSVSTYQSTTLARILVKLYSSRKDLKIEHRQGTVEEVIQNVENGTSELGIIYISKNYNQALLNILSQKKLTFRELGTAKACISVGPSSPLYHRTKIPYSELKNLHFVGGIRDYFSDPVFSSETIGIAASDALQADVTTNCNQMVSYLVESTDLVDFGINLITPGSLQEAHNYKLVEVVGSESSMILGYIAEQGHVLSAAGRDFVELVKELMDAQKH